jgi:hypothetical protein
MGQSPTNLGRLTQNSTLAFKRRIADIGPENWTGENSPKLVIRVPGKIASALAAFSATRAIIPVLNKTSAC